MSELRDMIRDTVSRLFAEMVTKEEIEAAEAGQWPSSLWRAVEEAGLLRPHLPETSGGAGGTWMEAFEIVRAAGGHTVPLPIAETIVAGWLLERAGLDVPEGPLTLVREPVPDQGSVEARQVPWGSQCGYAVGVGPDGRTIRLLEGRRALERRTGRSVALEPRDDLRWDDSAVVAAGEVDLPVDAVLLYGALVRAAQMAGALTAILEQAVQYAGERVQFGRPIAKFQVIQQELARLAGDAAAAGVAAEAAFEAAARADREPPFDPRFEIAVAKIRIGEAVDRATSIAHQTHGAIGFTYEHGLHFATRRLWAWRAEYGTDAAWAAELGREVIARGVENLWPDLTNRQGRA